MKLAALLLALVASACGAPREGHAAASPSVVRPEDLPARHRAVLAAWRKGGAAWEIERESVRRDPELARFLVDNLAIEMVRAFDRSNLARAGEAKGPFERAQDELVLLGEHSSPFLAQFLAVRDGIVAYLAADTLARIGTAAVDPVVEVLADPNGETRRRAAELLARLPHQGAREPAVLEALACCVEKDREWIVRGEAARALGERGSRHEHKGFAMGVLVRALADPDEAVAQAAGRALGRLGERRAIPRLVDALEAASQAGRVKVVTALSASLSALAGDGASRGVSEWRAWWREHEAEGGVRR